MTKQLKCLQVAEFGGWTVALFEGHATALDTASPYFLKVECPSALGVRNGRYLTTELRVQGFRTEQDARAFGNKVWALAKNGGGMAELKNLTKTS